MIFILTMIAVTILTGGYRLLAQYFQILDVPNSRSSHASPIVGGGGIIFSLVWLVVCPLKWTVILPIILLILVNYYDDIYSLSAPFRLMIQTTVMLLLLVALNYSQDISGLWLVIMMIAGIWSINLYNFMDGLDGFAAAQGLIYFSMGGWIYYQAGAVDAAASAWLLTAVLLGFFMWNFPRARIFMGDCGSAFLGLMAMLFAYQASANYHLSLLPWLMLYAGFIMDATITLCRRILSGDAIFQAHREHAYQRLHRSGWSHIAVTSYFILASVIPMLLTAWAVYYPSHALLLFALVYLYWFFIYVLIEKKFPMEFKDNKNNVNESH